MEGLIPFIYRAIKDRRTRSYSRCSSTGSAHGRFRARVEDSSWDGNQWEAAVRGGGGKVVSAESEMAHRRHRSLEELAGEVGASGAMPRGRSARFFSCINGM